MKEELDQMRDKTLENISAKVDKAAIKHEDKNIKGPRIKNGEGALLKFFPYFVIVCVVLSIVASVIPGFTLEVFLQKICVIFLFGFIILGGHCFFMMPAGIFSKPAMFVMALAISVMMGVYVYFLDTNVFIDAILSVLEGFGIVIPGLVGDIIAFTIGVLMIYLVPIAVCTVSSAYLRKFIPRMLNRIRLDAKTGTRGPLEGFFMIPGIIDVKDVTVDPPVSTHVFDSDTSLKLAFYNILMCMFISSYFFLSPFFIDMMTWQEMVILMIVLAMFIPVFTIIWQEIRLSGAKVVSDAPRLYELWEGAKVRLFTGFAALGMFMAMVFVAAYFGYSVWDMLMTYFFYLMPTLLISVYYGMVFSNNFSPRDVNEIKESFEKLKEEGF